MEYFTDANGWIGVGLGLLIFYMGYIKGVSKARALAPHIIDSTIQNLIDNGFIKTRKTLKNGKWEEDILRHDEEV
jgi:hypothetical protein